MTQTATRTRLRFHRASKQFIVRRKSKVIYLGRDETAAQSRLDSMSAVWDVEDGNAAMTTQMASDRIQEQVRSDVGDKAAYEFGYYIGKALDLWGRDRPIETVSAQDLQDLKAHLRSKLSPRSVNGSLSMAKRLLRYSAAMGWRAPIEMSHVKTVAMPAPKPKHFVNGDLRKLFDDCRDHQQLFNHLAIQLLVAGRPSETLRLVAGEYSKIDDNVVTLNQSKTETRMPRIIALSPLIQDLLSKTEKRYKVLTSYACATKRRSGETPHRLRHTAAFRLHRMGYSREEVDQYLGHAVKRVSAIYNPLDTDRMIKMSCEFSKTMKEELEI